MRLAPNRYLKQTDPELLDEKIREAIEALDSHWYKETSDAYIIPIREAILGERASVTRDGKAVYFTPEGLKAYLDAANLPIKAAIERALISGWAASNYQRFDGGDDRVLEVFRQEGHPEPTAQAFRGIINILGKEWGWSLNTNGQEQRLDKAVQMAKRAILQGKKQWPKWEPAYGQVRWHDAAELDRMSVDELLTTIEQVSSLTKQMSGSREDQRERLASFADAAAGIRRYREGDTDSLSGEVQYKEHSPNNAFEFVGEHSKAKPTADIKMDRSVATPTLSAEATQLFTDPATGKFYSRTSLHKLARTNPNLFRLMMRSSHIEFMNQLLAQDN